MRELAIGCRAVLVRDLRIFASYRLRPLTFLIGPLTTVCLFYYVSRLVKLPSLGASDGYFAFVVVGIVGLDVLTSTLGTTPSALRQELVAGTFERLLLSPLGATRAMVAMMLFPVVQAAVAATMTVAFATLLFGMSLAWPNALLALPAAALGALAFAPFGLLLVAGTLVVKQSLTAASIVLTGLSLFAGVYFPVRLLPGWLAWVAQIQPFTPALDLLRHVLVGARSGMAPAAAVGRLAGFAAVLLPISIWALARAIAYCQRRGTITEY